MYNVEGRDIVIVCSALSIMAQGMFLLSPNNGFTHISFLSRINQNNLKNMSLLLMEV